VTRRSHSSLDDEGGWTRRGGPASRREGGGPASRRAGRPAGPAVSSSALCLGRLPTQPSHTSQDFARTETPDWRLRLSQSVRVASRSDSVCRRPGLRARVRPGLGLRVRDRVSEPVTLTVTRCHLSVTQCVSITDRRQQTMTRLVAISHNLVSSYFAFSLLGNGICLRPPFPHKYRFSCSFNTLLNSY
jgi:hypothetical protein